MLAIISLDWYQVVWHHPLSPPFALLRRSFSFQQRQWYVYPAVLSKCQVLSTLLLIYSLKCSRGSGVDIHLPGSVYMCATWYNSSCVTGSSFPACIWFTRTYTSLRQDFSHLYLIKRRASLARVRQTNREASLRPRLISLLVDCQINLWLTLGASGTDVTACSDNQTSRMVAWWYKTLNAKCLLTGSQFKLCRWGHEILPHRLKCNSF